MTWLSPQSISEIAAPTGHRTDLLIGARILANAVAKARRDRRHGKKLEPFWAAEFKHLPHANHHCPASIPKPPLQNTFRKGATTEARHC
jgi:hypothetical protein